MSKMYRILSMGALLPVILGALVLSPTRALAIDPGTTNTISIAPDSGPVGTQFTIFGGHYDPVTTKVWFTNGTDSTFLTPSSYNSSESNFKVPDTLCHTSNPASCSIVSVPTGLGDYSIYMSYTPIGESPLYPDTNKVIFHVQGVNQDPIIHPQGTNIVGPDGTVYRVSDNHRYPYTSAGAFLSYGFNTWAGVQTAYSADLTLPVGAFIQPRNGSLINDHGTVYIISNGKRYGFTTEALFFALGYSYSNVRSGDTSFMNTGTPISSANIAHPYGSLVNDHGTLYVISSNGTRYGFPTPEVLQSWGYWMSETVTANSYDLSAPVGEVLQMRQMSDRMNI